MATLSLILGMRYYALQPKTVGTRDAVHSSHKDLVVVDRVSIWIDSDEPEGGLCQHVMYSFRRVFLDDAVMHSFA